MADEYFYQEYPKYLYHPDGRWTVVQDADQEHGMSGQGFVKSPQEYGVQTAPAAPLIQEGGFRQPGYVSPSSGGGAPGSTPSAQHTAAAAAAQQAETRRQQEEGNRQAQQASTSGAQSAAQAEVEKLEQEATQRRRP